MKRGLHGCSDWDKVARLDSMAGEDRADRPDRSAGPMLRKRGPRGGDSPGGVAVVAFAGPWAVDSGCGAARR